MAPIRFLGLVTLAFCVALTQASPASAQLMNSGMQLPNNMTPTMFPSGRITGAHKTGAANDPGIAISETFVGFIDSAVPRNIVGLRFESAFGNRQPMRAEYFHPKGGLGGNVGFPLPETRVDYQELTSFAEYSWSPWFSVFIEAPFRWLNPEINDNQSGASDMRYGVKLCTWSSDDFIASILLRVYSPSARRETLGTSHWSIEPGLLAAYRLNQKLQFEGEFRYWTALGGSDFAGSLLRYGAGVSYGQRKQSGLWYKPVIEAIGWTVLDGKTMVATSADSFNVLDADGHTIVNGYLGLRWGYGANLEFYAGYGRSFTGHFWQRDTYRFELRFIY